MFFCVSILIFYLSIIYRLSIYHLIYLDLSEVIICAGTLNIDLIILKCVIATIAVWAPFMTPGSGNRSYGCDFSIPNLVYKDNRSY